MPADLKVVDASAVAAVLFGEPEADSVAERLRDQRLIAPSILAYEVASVCRKKIRREPAARRTLLLAHGYLSHLYIREVSVPQDECLELALQTELTVYDAAYLWLSRSLAAELVTLDVTLDAAARKKTRRARRRT